MNKFLIEVPHRSDRRACEQTIRIFQTTGSHFLTNAHWGCKDGVHKAWIMGDFENKDEAIRILPPLYRIFARITELTNFSAEEILEPERYHG